jgi:uncharacterized phosphatase
MNINDMLSKFYIIRHGETDWNVLGLINGVTDRPLTNKGINQCKVAAEKIYKSQNGLNFKNILVSPLQRAKDTANIINEKLNLPIIEIEQFREGNCGELEGKPHPSAETWQKWENGGFIGNGVETFEACKNRVKVGLKKASKYENPLIVAHGGVFFEMCSILNIENLEDIHFTNCTLYCIENIGFGYRIFDVFED